MSGTGNEWAIHLSDAAARDLSEIVDWTARRFDDAQARIYAETLSKAIQALAAGPEIPGVKRRDDILKGVSSFHIARHGRKGRHFLVFRVAEQDRAIEVLRILHDAMDLVRHVSPTPPRVGNE